MLLARGFGALPIHAGTFSLPAQYASTASTYKPPPTGYGRGDIFYQGNQRRLMLYAQRDRVMNALRAGIPTGQLLPCSDPSLKLPSGKGLMLIKGMIGTTIEQTCSAYFRNKRIEDRYAEISGMDMTNPLGVIFDYTTLGVPFTPLDLKRGNPTHPDEPTIERTYVPTDDQRWLADRLIYLKSQIALAQMYFHVDLSNRDNLDEIMVDPNLSTGFIGLISRTGDSIRDFINRFRLGVNGNEPAFTTHLDYYGMNPIVPTSEEITGPNGLYNYYKRGGFLLFKPAARSGIEIAMGPLTFNYGYCYAGQCSDQGARQPVVLQQKFPGEGEGWLTFVTVGPQYTIRIQAKEKSTAEKVIDKISGALEALVKLFCQAAPMITSFNTNTLATETCSFPDGTPCTRGQTKTISGGAGQPCVPGPNNASCGPDGKTTGGVPYQAACNCATPTSGQQAAVALSNYMITQACGAINAAPPGAIPLPPPAPPSTTIPTWAIVAGVGLVAVLVFSNTRK